MISRDNRFHGHRAVSGVRGTVIHSRLLTLRVAINKKQDYRLAVVVSKKVAASAVARNRMRRRIFEIIRTQKRVNNLPLDLVIYIKTDAVSEISAKDLEKEVLSLSKKALATLPR